MSEAQTPATEAQKREMAERVLKVRGFAFGLHQILAEADWEFLQRLEHWVEYVYLSDRYIDRRMKELVIIAMLTSLRTLPEHLHAHMLAAVKAGATRQQIIEV